MINVPFGKTCKLQNGRAFKPSEWSDDGTPIIRIQNLNDELKPFNYCDFEVEERFHIKSGDLLFSWSGTPGTSFGAFFWNRGKGFLNQHIFRVDVYETKFDKNYLHYAINSKLNLIIDQAHGGVGLKHITKGKLEAIEILNCPLKEQKRIAAILGKADNLRRKRQRAIKLADEFLRSVFLDMFGDPVTNPKMWDVGELKSSITHANNGLSRRRKVEQNIGDIVLRLQDVHYDGIRFEKDLNRIELDENEKPRYLLEKGDIVFIRVNGNPDYVGRSAVFMEHDENIYHNDHIIRLKVNDTYNSEFLSYVFNYKGGRKIISKQVKTSAGQHTINQGGIEKLEIYRPNRELQDKFIQIKNKVLKIPYELSGLDNCFNSLSQKAFAGVL